MKFSFPTVMTLITILVSASAESIFLRGASMNHEDGMNFNHRTLRGDAEVMVKEEENFASKPSRDNGDGEGRVKEEESQVRMPTRQLAPVQMPTRHTYPCLADHDACGGSISCEYCCSGISHLGPLGLEPYCGPQTSCWGKNTVCVPGISCTKCCNSWSWDFICT